MSSSSSIINGAAMPTNLTRFLQTVTPAPLCKFAGPPPQSHDLNSQLQLLQINNGQQSVDYFTLEDLWKCYDEFSASGAGTVVSLGGNNTTTQYYVPYLSAIQLYTNKPFSASSHRSSGGHDGNSVEVEKDSTDGDNVPDDSSHKEDKLGPPYFSFIESCSPYSRHPLSEKVAKLAVKNPALITLTSVDLSPASWISIAWYPIYNIPRRGSGQEDLETCFLTFHTLSSSSQDGSRVTRDDGKVGIPLPPFGLGTYKLRGDLWIADGDDFENYNNLGNAADSWLKKLGVFHHDYQFFYKQSFDD